jgi:hypothetical protein
VRQVVEVVVVEALVAKLPVKAFDVGVLCRLAGRDELSVHAALVGPTVQCPTCKLWALIGADGAWEATELLLLDDCASFFKIPQSF